MLVMQYMELMTATVKDIYFDDTPGDNINNPRWRTILMSALGAGGHGYFVLDITNINSPKHLFAIENDPFDKKVNIWGSGEQKNHTVILEEQLMKTMIIESLGEAWSAPRYN